ncbi:MAG: hypothetical protein QOE57_3180, partial [Acidimicrobiaceae bacterium]|nr:hypothetical protein [Acidimicrobiaceae bacterium]
AHRRRRDTGSLGVAHWVSVRVVLQRCRESPPAVLFRSRHGEAPDPFGLEILKQAGSKRVALTIKPAKVTSWDHRKLGGLY